MLLSSVGLLDDINIYITKRKAAISTDNSDASPWRPPAVQRAATHLMSPSPAASLSVGLQRR